MSKVDALRALREARYAAAASQQPAPVPAPVRRSPVATGPVAISATAQDTCGHRNMGGRTCTRPQGHSETSHRYAPKV